jgi:phosphate transport system permease protein
MGIRDIADDSDTASSIRPRRPLDYQLRRAREALVHFILFACAFISIFTTLAIIFVLFEETIRFFAGVSIVDFLTDRQWTPSFKPQHFGIAPLMVGTLLVAAGAALIAIPVGLASAIFLSEYAPEHVRSLLKPALEVLAGIPTVVYGYFALMFITKEVIRPLFPESDIFNAASASIVMGIMIIPLVSSLSEDAMSAVPRSLREGAYALGATKFEVARKVVVPAALSGIIASFILAVSRAIGETMIVAVAAGQSTVLNFNPLKAMETMTAYIARVSLGDNPQQSIEFKTIFAVAMLLFLMTFALNLISQRVLARFRQVYQ